jgi:predicted nucleotidyltransferase
MLAREGDFIQHKSNVIFDVKGLIHPNGKVIAYPRYIPDPEGPRHGPDMRYGKVYSLEDRFQFLQTYLPHLLVFDEVFGETLCEVPTNEITQHFKPQEKLLSLHTNGSNSLLEEKALQFAIDIRQKTGISLDALGVSGSILADLTTKTSDIDLLIYGEANCRKAYTALQCMFKEGHPNVKAYTTDELKTLYDFRSKDTHMSFEDFKQVENRKAFQGMYQGTDFFVRFVKDWPELSEQYGDIHYSNAGYIKITATINNKTAAIFTPCTYQLENVKILQGPNISPIHEISSFRGRFCEQAEKGETITAQGKTELVVNKKSGDKYYRLILGSKPEDYMILRNHLMQSF